MVASIRRLAWLVAVSAGTIFAAAWMVALTRPTNGLGLALPFSEVALRNMALRELSKQRFVEARALAGAAIDRAPLDVAALRAFGLANTALGRPEGSRSMTLAALRGWRDMPTQLWFANASIRAADWASAIDRLDALLRLQKLRGPWLATMHRIATIPAARPALLARLNEGPPWRSLFLADVNGLDAAALAQHASIAEHLAAAGKLPPDEVDALAARLIATGDDGRAFTLTRHVHDAALSAPLLDSDLRKVRASTGAFDFTWRSWTSAGLSVETNDSGVLIQADPALSSTVLGQQLRLSPGRYQLEVTANELFDASSRYTWQLECSGEKTILPLLPASIPSSRSATRWTFELPASGCATQLLTLSVVAAGQDPGKPLQTTRVTIAALG